MAESQPENDPILRALERIADGDYTNKACKAVGISRGMLWRRVEGPDASPELASMYARARESQADAHADKIAQLADQVVSGEVGYNEGRVAIDAHKWSASKLRPRVYGDRTTHDVSVVSLTTTTLALDAALASGLRALGAQHARHLTATLLPAEASAEAADPPTGGE